VPNSGEPFSYGDDSATARMLKSLGVIHWPSKYDSEDDETDVAEVLFSVELFLFAACAKGGASWPKEEV